MYLHKQLTIHNQHTYTYKTIETTKQYNYEQKNENRKYFIFILA